MNGLKKIKYNSPVILTFTLISFVVLILGYLTGGRSTEYAFCVYRGSWSDPMFYVRWFTHVLGHADWQHFLNNFMMILLVGPMLEEKYGSDSLLFMIVVTAGITGVINIIFFDTALLGASGVAFMLILLSSFANNKEGDIPLTLILVSGLYIGNEVVNGIISQDNISQITHIIGGVCGAICGFTISKKSR